MWIPLRLPVLGLPQALIASLVRVLIESLALALALLPSGPVELPARALLAPLPQVQVSFALRSQDPFALLVQVFLVIASVVWALPV